MKISRVVIVGLGSIGRRHLRLIKELRPGIEITLVRSGKGDKWPEETLASHVVDSIEAALDSFPDAAIISSPANVHLEQAMAFAEAGVHLLVEKPLSVSAEGVDRLLEVARQSRIHGLVGYVLRYDPAARLFKEYLQKAEIGGLIWVRVECGSFLPEWRPGVDYRHTVSARKALGGGVLLELSHEFDYLTWFFGNPVMLIGQMSRSGLLDIDVEDQVDMLLTCADGLVVSVHLDFVRCHSTRECVVQTTKGQLIWNAIGKRVIWQPKVGEPTVRHFNFNGDYIYRDQLRHLLACVEEGEAPVVTLEDGANVMRVIDAARRSHDLGKRVSLT